MTVNIFLLSLYAAICIVTYAQLHPIETDDLQAIVENIKKDVDRHLKLTSAGRRIQSVSEKGHVDLENAAVVEDLDDFMEMIKDSIHHHMLKNVDLSSDAENGESAEHSTETTTSILATESIPDSDPSSKSADDYTSASSSEVHEMRVGSVKGVTGVNFPGYTEIPITSFTCSDKMHLPGFYADLDTGCQVFHVCWPDRRESFLCPMGTTFNQALLVCDYWYNSNCSLATYYYSVNMEMESGPSKAKEENKSSMINILLEKTDPGSTSKPEFSIDDQLSVTNVLSFVSQFIPIKAKIVVYPETESHRSKIVASASIGEKIKSNSKSKSRPKRSLKPLSVPLSDEKTNIPTTVIRMAELKSKIFATKLITALDLILIDVKSDRSLSKLLWYVESTVKFLKTNLEDYTRGLSEQDILEPGSELHEYDLVATEALENLPGFVKTLLINITHFVEEVENRMKTRDSLKEDHKPAAFQQISLKHLNPRFMVKCAVGKTAKLEPSKPLKEKKSGTTEHPLKLLPTIIDSRTKESLLRNYIKLFKTKFA